MHRSTAIALITLMVVTVLGPLLYNGDPLYLHSPDIQYLKGKVLRVLEGDLYGDPITGYPTLHPPVCHLFLAGLVAIGINIDTLLFMMTILLVTLTLFFTFEFVRTLFNVQVALISTFLLPFCIEFIGIESFYLASAFYYSLPFFLAGLWLFAAKHESWLPTVGYASLWGMAFLISPGYLFLIALLVLAEVVVRRRTKHFLIAAGTLVIVLIPFLIQTYTVLTTGMFGTEAFALWRGIPGAAFFVSMATQLLNPGLYSLTAPIVWLAVALQALGVAGVLKRKRGWWLVVIGIAAYALTCFHYAPQYAVRIQLLVLILLLPYAVWYLLQLRIRPVIPAAVLTLFILYGVYHHYHATLDEYTVQNESTESYVTQINAGCIDQLGRYVGPDDYILATSETYRTFVLPNLAVHALKAWHSGEYFQLESSTSSTLEKDYAELMLCRDTVCLNRFCEKYDLRIALLHAKTELQDYPVFQVIDRTWDVVSGSPFFRIYRRPSPAATG